MNIDIAALLPSELGWREHLGTMPDAVSIVAFYDQPGDRVFSFEIGYPNPNGIWTNAAGYVIEDVWAFAPLTD